MYVFAGAAETNTANIGIDQLLSVAVVAVAVEVVVGAGPALVAGLA